MRVTPREYANDMIPRGLRLQDLQAQRCAPRFLDGNRNSTRSAQRRRGHREHHAHLQWRRPFVRTIFS